MSTNFVDVLVIGGGVIGLAIAKSFAAKGREVIVLEKEDFKNANKDLKKNQSFMNNLSNKTLINNMRKINNFILNENK